VLDFQHLHFILSARSSFNSAFQMGMCATEHALALREDKR